MFQAHLIYMFCPRPQISTYPRSSGYFSWKVVFQDHSLGAGVAVYWVGHCFWAFTADRAKKIFFFYPSPSLPSSFQIKIHHVFKLVFLIQYQGYSFYLTSSILHTLYKYLLSLIPGILVLNDTGNGRNRIYSYSFALSHDMHLAVSE